MKIASFDIGIKNMAYCIFECSPLDKSWSVVDWAVLDLITPTETTQYVCGCVLSEKTKKSKIDRTHPKTCGKKAKYCYTSTSSSSETTAFCEKHAKAQTNYLIPSKEYTIGYLRKQTVGQIQELYKTLFSGDCTVFPNKPEMIETIDKYYASRLFSEIRPPKSNANDANLIHIGWAIRKHLDECTSFQNITHVVIENQISPIATRMKTIQGMLAQYFIMKSPLDHPIEIFFVSSSNKLRITKSDVPKKTVQQETTPEKTPPKYKQNKKDGVSLCTRYIDANPGLAKWSSVMTVSKKDDLADCFLQGVWFLTNRNIINCAENLKINIV